jgi:hypothetical protein
MRGRGGGGGGGSRQCSRVATKNHMSDGIGTCVCLERGYACRCVMMHHASPCPAPVVPVHTNSQAQTRRKMWHAASPTAARDSASRWHAWCQAALLSKRR